MVCDTMLMQLKAGSQQRIARLDSESKEDTEKDGDSMLIHRPPGAMQSSSTDNQMKPSVNSISSVAMAVRRTLRAESTHLEQSVEYIRHLVDNLFPQDVGLEIPKRSQLGKISRKKDRTSKVNGKFRTIQYLHLWEDEQFSMGIFVLPPRATIPLHDHPGMSVLSRVLYGTVHARAFDLVAGHNLPNGLKGRLARRTEDCVLEGPVTIDLLPNKRNIHEFVAGKEVGCAILDVLMPPYNPSLGRDCNYYVEDFSPELQKVVKDTNLSTATHAILAPYSPPSAFRVIGSAYNGPPVTFIDSEEDHVRGRMF